MRSKINIYVGYIYKIFKEIINLIYPIRCPVCDDIISRQGSLCHEKCLDKLVYIKEPLCKKCGKRVEDDTIEICYDCTKRKKAFKEGRAVFLYNDLMKESIIRFKYKGRREYGRFYASQIVDVLGEYIIKHSIDAIMPVPIHPSKLRSRGYNQADVIAKEVGKRLDIPVLSKALVRNVNTAPQKGLDNVQRYANLNNVFSVNKEDKEVYNKLKVLNNILIIDDIYTTGATINNCAKALSKRVEANVYFVVLSIGESK